LACVGVGALVAWVRLRAPVRLDYSPYQNLMPIFDPVIGVTLMLLLVPLVTQSSRS
jgi:hypothetical protein